MTLIFIVCVSNGQEEGTNYIFAFSTFPLAYNYATAKRLDGYACKIDTLITDDPNSCYTWYS